MARKRQDIDFHSGYNILFLQLLYGLKYWATVIPLELLKTSKIGIETNVYFVMLVLLWKI